MTPDHDPHRSNPPDPIGGRHGAEAHPRPGGHDPARRRPTPAGPTRPGPAAASRRRRVTVRGAAPIPCTVWLCHPPAAGIPDTGLASVVGRAATAFSPPGGRVGLLRWPTPTSPAAPARGRAPHPVAAESPDHHAAAAARDARLSEAITAVTERGRTPMPLWIATTPAETPTSPTATGEHADTTTTAPTPGPAPATGVAPATTAPQLDLIITWAAPAEVDDDRARRVTHAAAQLLRPAGILAVLTHSDRAGGVFIDPGGVLVSASQEAQLRYLQHLIAVDGGLPDQSTPAVAEPARPTLGRAAAADRRPVRHRRIHRDLYIFSHQPRPTDDPSGHPAARPGADPPADAATPAGAVDALTAHREGHRP